MKAAFLFFSVSLFCILDNRIKLFLDFLWQRLWVMGGQDFSCLFPGYVPNVPFPGEIRYPGGMAPFRWFFIRKIIYLTATAQTLYDRLS